VFRNSLNTKGQLGKSHDPRKLMRRLSESSNARHEGQNAMLEHQELLREFQDFAATAPTAKSVMERIAQRLHEKMSRYNWIGFYLVDPAEPGVLRVGPFVGSFTPNERIPLDTGLCGAAASSGQIVVVHDVSKDPRYLAGSPLVKSEIVIPIFVKNKLAGELDIESYFAGTFTKPEQDFAEACANVVGKYLGKK
jgi:GAF domain-containing protein